MAHKYAWVCQLPDGSYATGPYNESKYLLAARLYPTKEYASVCRSEGTPVKVKVSIEEVEEWR